MNARNLLLTAVLAATMLAPLHASNVTDGTYTFTATDGHTQLDGSWVTFSGDQIVDWTMLDPIGAADNAWTAGFFGPGYLLEFPPLTPSNSSVFDVLTYPDGTGPDAFSFRIASPASANPDPSSWIWYFSGQNNLNGESALYDGITYNNPEPFDPIGVWTMLSVNPTGNVPDASNTGTLLLFGLAAFAPLKRLARR